MITHRNRIRNPRFHANVADGWYYGATHVRDASPPVALPSGCDAAVHVTATGNSGESVMTALDMGDHRWGNPVVGTEDSCMSFFAYTPPPPSESTESRLRLTLTFYDADYNSLPDNYFELPATEESSAAFHEYVMAGIAIPAGAAYCLPEFIFTRYGVNEARQIWITGVMFDDVSGVHDGYGDGSAGAGWAWEGAEHNSYSEHVADEPVQGRVTINGGAAYCFSDDVKLTVDAGSFAADHYRVKNDGGAYGSWLAYPAADPLPWTLDAGYGERKVWAQFKSGAAEAGAVAATIEVVRRPNLGGEGVDVLDATWTGDIHAGFQSATLTVLPPRGVSKYADSVLDPVELPDLDQHILFEGRVEEPGITFTGDDKRELECTGYAAYLSDNETFRRCYIDSSVEHWRFDQATKYGDRFFAGIEDENRLVLRVAAGSTTETGTYLPDGANGRMYWELFDGAGDTAETLRGFKFHYEADGMDLSLRARLYGRDKLSGGSINRLLWTCPSTYGASGDVTLDSGDIGSDITCLVWKLDQNGGVIDTYADLDTGYVDEWKLAFGIAITHQRVAGSDLGFTITPEGVVRDVVSTIVDADHMDFPDASGQVIGQLYYIDFLTQGEAIEQVNKLLDWSYGFDEGSVFFYRKPWTSATAPDVETIVVSMADPLMSGWGVRLDYAECYNKVVASYQATPDKIDTVTVSEADGPLGTNWRVKYLDLTGECDDRDTAEAVARRCLADNLWPKPTGSCTLADAAHLACGLTARAIHAKPGMMLYNMDVPLDRGGGKLLVTSVDGSLSGRRITLNVGVRSNRLDRWLAAREMKARAQSRKRRRR